MYLLACCSVNSMRGVIDSFDAETVCMTAMQNSIGILWCRGAACAASWHRVSQGSIICMVVALYLWVLG
jgi:hypothetical protein